METSAPLVPAHGGRPGFQKLRVLFALVAREASTQFGRSVGGYFWAIAQPLAGILLLAVAFSLALRTPPLGTNFILFYSTGTIPFAMFNALAGGIGNTVGSNRGLLAYPVVSVLDAVFGTFILTFMTNAIIALLLYSGIILVLGLYVSLDLAAIALAFVLAAMLGLGVGTLNCVLFGFFPTWKNIWKVLTRPLFILSGILFTFESVPARFQGVLVYNPLVHIIGLMRSGFYGAYDPQYISLPYVLGIAGSTFVIGAYLLRRHASYLIEQ
jgi:capsular polysaccharide transport system permease protein